MKILLLLFLASAGITQTTKADTIDYWHVYYNNIKIKEFNGHNEVHEITIKIDKIKNGDSISVNYYRDTHCSDCITHLTIEDGKHHTISTHQGKGAGEGNPLSFALKDLLEFRKKDGGSYFEIFYYDNAFSGPPTPGLLFRIKFE